MPPPNEADSASASSGEIPVTSHSAPKAACVHCAPDSNSSFARILWGVITDLFPLELCSLYRKREDLSTLGSKNGDFTVVGPKSEKKQKRILFKLQKTLDFFNIIRYNI
jgi:hypothetical protein